MFKHTLWNTVGEMSICSSPYECVNYFAAAGYDPE